jgi:hypothetical protein
MTALDDNHTCGNCFCYSHNLGVCLLSCVEVANNDTCLEWYDEARITKGDM